MKRFFQLALASMGGGLIVAYSFAIGLEPAEGLTGLFAPAIFEFATIGGLVGGLLVFPVVFVCLREKPLRFALPILYSVVALSTFLITLFLPALDTIIFSFVLTILLLAILRVVKFPTVNPEENRNGSGLSA